MSRSSALSAEVLGGLDQTTTKHLSPEPVHRDARRQGMLRAKKPVSQAETVVLHTFWKSGEYRRCVGADSLPRGVVGAALQNVTRFRPRQFLHHHGFRDGMDDPALFL